MRTNPSSVLVAAWLSACGTTESIPAAPVEATAAPPAESCKPEAPVRVEVAARPLGSGGYEITMRATPTTPATTVELALIAPGFATQPIASFGPTAANVTRTLTATTPSAGAVHAVAKVPVDGIAMTRTASITLGPPAPAPRTRTYALPDGERAKELRP